MKHSKTIYLNNKFLCYLLIISGIVVFVENNKYNRLRRGLQIILVAIYIFILVKSIITNHIFLQDTFFRSSAILSFISQVYVYGYPTITIIAMLIDQSANETNIYVWKEINKIDDTLETLGLQEKVINQNRKTRFISNVFIVYYILQFVIVIAEHHTWYQLLSTIGVVFINGLVKVQYYIFISSIRQRIRILNNFLKKKLKTSLPGKHYKLSEKVTIVIDEHTLLTNLARTINKTNSILLFTYICLNVGLVITHSYMLIYVSVTLNLKEMARVLYNILPNLLSVCFELYFMTSCSSSVCSEANATKAIFYEIVVDSQNTVATNIIKQTSFHLMNNKLSITAMKLFNVDFTMIYSILATTTNYLLIMLQFDLDSIKRAGKKITNVFENV
ncbi:hypothetical protein FQA39_LY11276 [Lamprigera yunnana]|nr:hypothetical protein FQA39_LY11276 [Lamprigera yunnana]